MDASGALDRHRRRRRSVGLPATEIAALVRSGEVTAVDVVRAHLAHIDAVDARIGAFRVVRARGRAGRGARRRHGARPASPCRSPGVPDRGQGQRRRRRRGLHRRVAGLRRRRPATARPPGRRPAAQGRRGRRRHHPRARAVPLRAPPTGPARSRRNPWDTARSPAGQLRRQRRGGRLRRRCRWPTATTAWARCGCPAAACGLVTLKPGRGVVPAEIGADSWSGMAENGALATTVADLAVAHAVLAGEEPAPPPAPGPAAADRASPPGRRCPGVRADAATRAAVDAVVAAAARPRGTPSSGSDPPITARRRRRARWPAGWPAPRTTPSTSGLDRRAAAAAQPHARPDRPAGPPGRAGPAGARPSAFRERMVGFFDDVDVLLSPVTTGPPLAARPWHERSFLANVTANARWAPWTAAWNLAGLPALVLPAGSRPEGLPAGRPVRRPPGRREATTLAGRRAGAPAAVAPLRTRLRPHRRHRPRRPSERSPARRADRSVTARHGARRASGNSSPTGALASSDASSHSD